jgi:UPF0755 protein
MWVLSEIAPIDRPTKFVRFEKTQRFSEIAPKFAEEGLVRNGTASAVYARLWRKDILVRKGTYMVNPKVKMDDLIRSMGEPIRNLFRLPETNLSYRSANLLDKAEIADANEYNALVKDPAQFKGVVSFALPKDSLEGYLYPDTYDLPQLIGAKAVIERQIKNFEKKVLPLLPNPAKRNKMLTIASMVEMEAAVPEDRALIAGVIVNRLEKGMKLEIDATVLYALQEWRRLYNKDYRSTDSPYNTYVHKGLPPGPICSPTVESVRAALKPAKNSYLYYVAMPTKKHLFATTYGEHLKNIVKAKKMVVPTASRMDPIGQP